MNCSKCRGQMRYAPDENTIMDAHGAQSAGRHVGNAFNAGHPGVAVAWAGYGLASLAAKKVYRHFKPYVCSKCGHRAG